MNYIRFTGDYSQLKTMGYTFQRLYARNYLQWHNSGTRIWKKGAEVTLDRLTNCEGSFFELYLQHRDALPWNRYEFNQKALRVIVNRADYTASFDYASYHKQAPASRIECVVMLKCDQTPLDDLIDLGWVELASYNEVKP